MCDCEADCLALLGLFSAFCSTVFWKQNAHCATHFFTPLCTFCAGEKKLSTAHCYLCPKLPCQDTALHLSGPLSVKRRGAFAKQRKKETQTCCSSLPIASFHRLPEITTVHQAEFGPGPSPWFPRFTWLSRRQQPPAPPLHRLLNASAVLRPIPPPLPPLIHAVSLQHLSQAPTAHCVLEDSLTTGSPPPRPCSRFHSYSLCLHAR